MRRSRRLWARGRPAVMGILNVTPDSFADGGAFSDPAEAVEHAVRLSPPVPTSSTSVASPPGPARRRSRPTSSAPGSSRSSPSCTAGSPARSSRSTPRRPRSPRRRSTPVPRWSTTSRRAAIRRCSHSSPRGARGSCSCTCAASRARCSATPPTPTWSPRFTPTSASAPGRPFLPAFPGDRVLLDPGIGFGKDAGGQPRASCAPSGTSRPSVTRSWSAHRASRSSAR